MARTSNARLVQNEHVRIYESYRQKFEDACLACGVTFSVRETLTSSACAVALSLPNLKAPALHGVITPMGFSLNLEDLGRLTGPEKSKLRDVLTMLRRM